MDVETESSTAQIRPSLPNEESFKDTGRDVINFSMDVDRESSAEQLPSSLTTGDSFVDTTRGLITPPATGEKGKFPIFA